MAPTYPDKFLHRFEIRTLFPGSRNRLAVIFTSLLFSLNEQGCCFTGNVSAVGTGVFLRIVLTKKGVAPSFNFLSVTLLLEPVHQICAG
jgi:hypothetical protein